MRRKTHRIKNFISIAVIASMLLGLASCKTNLNSHIRVEDEISKLNNVERNIYVSGNEDYEAIANYLQYIATESDFKGSMIVATDDEIIFAAGTGLLDVDGGVHVQLDGLGIVQTDVGIALIGGRDGIPAV